MSTSINKKGITDFLWEWADTHGDWAKNLIQKIILSERALNSIDRQEVFDYFLQKANLKSGMPVLNIAKPHFNPAGKNIKLIRLSQVTGVNRLAKNQTLQFSPNVTVIFGENGSGKTGYSRILRSLGYSYDPGIEILPNIHGNTQAKSAIVDFEIDGLAKSFAWSGTPAEPGLQNISVFNNQCVQISLSDRRLIVSPIGFNLFNLVTSELQELQKLFDLKKNTYSVDLPWAENLTSGTPQQVYIGALHSKSSEDKLSEISIFNADYQNLFDEAVSKLQSLNKLLLISEIASMSAQLNELETLVNAIKTDSEKFTKSNWDDHKDCIKEIRELEDQTKLGLSEIGMIRGINMYESEQFKSFILSAENYVRLLERPTYPSKDDQCVYCLQPLDSAAQKLLSNYRKLLNDKIGEDLEAKKESRDKVIRIFNSALISLSLHQPTFGQNPDGAPVQPVEILDYNNNAALFKSKFLNDELEKDHWEEFKFTQYSEILIKKKLKLKESITSKENLLETLGQEEQKLRNTIDELRDRKLLSEKISEVKTVIVNHKILQVFKDHSSVFVTTAISRKTSEAREALVTQDFNNLFQKELQAFRKSDIKVDLQFGTEKGHSKITQRISAYEPAQILSEGEQKAIALAEFLTEIQLDNIKAPVIFDDPVNSLDSKVIDETAKRLIRLSETRQVIIFSHCILLMYSLIQQKVLETNKKIVFSFHMVKKNFEETGVLTDFEEVNTYKYYAGKLGSLLNSGTTGKDEEQMAREGYGHLRSMIEIFVEEDFLKKVVKRYHKGIAFPALLRLEGKEIDSHKGPLNDIYEKCCVSISGHSSTTIVYNTPMITQLKEDFASFLHIRKIFV